jgi:hypothetical protein
MSTINSKNVQVGTSNVAAENFTLYQPSTPDGTVRLGVGNSGATTGDVVTVNSAGMTVTGTLTATTLSGSLGAATATSLTVNGNNISAVNSLGFRNRIINGDMRIDQRNAGASVTVTGNPYTLDRWYSAASVDGKYTVQQNAGSVTPPAGYTNYLGCTVGASANVTVGAGDYFGIRQAIEGYNVSDFGFGAATASTVTLSFWVRSSVTGTYGATLKNSASNRSYPFTYAINSANTWEQKSVTVAGDTTGTWLTTNGVGLYITFGLGVGATYSGTAGAWAASNLWSATGATNWIQTNSATFYITGVQLEAGTVASPFERRDYGRELMMCQRYFWKWKGTPSRKWIVSGMILSTTNSYCVFHTKQTMRAEPTMGTSGTAGDYCLYQGNSLHTCTSVPSISASDVDTPTFDFRSTGMTDGRASLNGSNNDNGFITLSAEL